MKGTLTAMITVLVLAMAASTDTSAKNSESQLPLNEVVESGGTKTFGHQRSVVMVAGFWAKAGSTVTIFIDELSNTLIQMADPVVIPPDVPSRTFSEITGSPGTDSNVVEIGDGASLPNPASYYAVAGIGIEENHDNPCRLLLIGGMVDPAYKSSRILAKFELDKCRSLSTFIDFKQATLPKSADRFVTFVRGVRVCGGHRGILPQEMYVTLSWEIKGLQVLGGRVVPETDEVQPQDKIVEFTRTNCNKNEPGWLGPGWTNWNVCPSGELMTGVRVYWYQDKWFTGLSAICKVPQRSTPPRKPVKDADGF